jgi:8-oxo-dGTP pyrophosphatase MutT (NUDIX family)
VRRKRYAQLCIFNSNMTLMLTIRNHRGPQAGKINAIGGKIEEHESECHAAWREAYEETGYSFDIEEIKDNKLCSVIFEKEELHVFYALLPFRYADNQPGESAEGILEWVDTDTLMNSNTPNLAGVGNLSFFVRYARIKENERRNVLDATT